MNTPTDTRATSFTVVAPSSRKALRLVREKLGPDAFVISNRVTSEGIEIEAMLEDGSPELAPCVVASALLGTVVARPSIPVKPVVSAVAEVNDSVLQEIHSMRGMIEEQLAGLAWNDKQRRDPVRGHLLRTLLGAGFSARMAKEILESLATGQSYAAGLDYVKSELARQIPVLENEDALMDAGGVYALMGPTGVGKTTTTAKLAARCVMRFGAEKLALVTTDSYRIGAYEQLRIYGQILGVSVHAVKDPADMERVLGALHDKHMVLIDTVGMSQRDRAVSEQIAMLCSASRPVKRLLLLNATSHGDTLNEVVQAYRHGEKMAGMTDLAGCIFTKVDEATHPGALIDMAIRHQLPVHYISSGQKVPEHLMLVDRSALIDSVFQAKSRSALFVPGEADLDEVLAPLRNDVEVVATKAINERLRSQCQQLIRTLTHSAQELAANAAALANGQIGFDEARTLSRKLIDADVGADEVARMLLSQACADSLATCNDYVLSISDEINLASAGAAFMTDCVFSSTLLLSDRNGLPFAAPLEVIAGSSKQTDLPVPAISAISGWLALPESDKPVVKLFSRLPSVELIQSWQIQGLHWASSASSALCIVGTGNAAPQTLAKLAEMLSFSVPQPIMLRGKNAMSSVAEALVCLDPVPQSVTVDMATVGVTLRCVVRRIVDADSGKLLMHSYVLASTNITTKAEELACWPLWRAAAEPYFKLLKHAILQFAGPSCSPGPLGEHAALKPFLIAAHAATTVYRLQSAQASWADEARKELAKLAGRSVHTDRLVPGTVLLEGLEKLFVLLDVLEIDGAPPLARHVLPLIQA